MKIKCLFLVVFFSLTLFFISSCVSVDEAIDVDPIWSQADIQGVGDIVNSAGGVQLVSNVKVNMDIPFYSGNLPLEFEVVKQSISPGMSSGFDDTTLQYTFNDFRVLFMYPDRQSLLFGLPEGAVALDLDKHIRAECKVIKKIIENRYLKGYEIMEIHYNTKGDAIFSSIFTVNAQTGIKEKENSKQGRKKKEYFFIWPGQIGSY